MRVRRQREKDREGDRKRERKREGRGEERRKGKKRDRVLHLHKTERREGTQSLAQLAELGWGWAELVSKRDCVLLGLSCQ